jgi:lysophospholipase L1-like esterase
LRYNKSLFDKVKTGNFLGVNRPNGRVTVDPYWKLEKTPPVYGNSFKGPFRYYTNYDAASSTPGVEEYEIPSIKSIQWNRSTSQDLGSCTITLYNMWHNLNSEEQELAGQLGKKGYFWPKRGQGDSSTTWNQEAGKGAYRKDGTWDAQFSWENVLVEDVILRAYEGYGGHSSDDTYVSIDENLDDGDLLLTGVWIVNTVSAGSDGMMTLECTDIGRILIDQIVYPPVIPSGAYPLEYYPPGKSAFDSPWGPTLRDKDLQEDDISPGQRGEVWVRSSSWSGSSDGTISSLYPASNVTDGDWDTYSLSEAYDTMNEGRPYWEFLPGAANTSSAAINSLQFKPWGGGYTVYISIAEDSNPASPSSSYQWEGTENIPGGGIPYVNKVQVPMYIPDGMEYPVNVDFANYVGDDTFYERPTANTYHAKRIRLTFENLNYSHVADGTKRYRAGIRDLTLYREGSNFSDYAPISGSTPWTFCIEQHPVRGYWVIDSTGRVYGFGDASDYDFNRFGDVPISDYGPNNRAVGIAAHPSGEGYWVVDWMGHVFAYGASQQLGWTAVPDPYVGWNQQGKVQVRGIASTHTGEGYWVVYSNGIIRGFGDASPSYAVVPANDVAIFMDAFLSANYDIGKYVPYSIGLKATAIASHPTKMGFWVTDGSGQVWGFGACASFGGLVNRVYNEGMAGRFKLQPLEWATAIESTPSGNGYWIAFGSGRVASFGDAKSLGKDPYVINSMYQDFSLEEENVIYDDNIEFDNSFFRRIMWGLARDPSGTGFWVLAANGDVTPYDADFWGEPGYTGLTGYKWHEGNFNGDWMELVKEILMWGGFLFYDSDITSDEEPSVYGNLESTGIFTDTYVSGDKFDKKTLMDVIKELTEVVGYRFRIDEEGRVRYESPNFWRAGNFDRDGISIYVDEIGERVDPEDEGASPFIPVIHESEELLQYNVTLSSADKRSEIIIGTDSPNPKDPTRTGYVIHYPPHSLERVAGNTPTMRGIERTAMWISELFENEQERRLMAELIGLHAWFASRTGSCSISANPCLSIDDQVRIVERNTSETFIHLINSISSNNDLDTGEYTMDLSTNWLGDADDWVIKNKDEPSNYVYTVISENLDSWQIKTNRGLGVLGDARKEDSIVTSFGEFTTTVSSVEPSSEMIVLGDSMSYLDSTLDGLSNDEWPQLLDNIGFADVIKNGAMSGYTSQDLVDDPIVAPESTDILVVFIGANDQNESLSGVSPAEFYTNINSLLTNYPANQQLVVFPWRWTGYPESEPDPAPTPEEYDAYAAQAELVANDNDASFLHLGEKIEAISGSTWDDYIVDWIHPSKIGHEFIADQVVSALYASEEVLANNWVMEGNFKITGTISNFNIVVESLSNLGQSIFLEVRNSSNSIIFASTLTNNGQVLSLGSLGNDSSQETYSFRITGIPTVKGTGQVRLSFRDGNVIRSEVEDSIVFLED